MLDAFFSTLSAGVAADPLIALLLMYVAGIPAGVLLAGVAVWKGRRLADRDALLEAIAPPLPPRPACARRSRGTRRPALHTYRLYGACR